MNENIKAKLRLIARIERAAFASFMTSGFTIMIALCLDNLTGNTSRLFIPTMISATMLGLVALPLWVFAVLARIGGAK